MKLMIAGAIFVAIGFGLAGTADVEEAERQLSHYCEMVQIYKDTNGEAGWPAYEGERQCRGGE